MGRYEPAVMVGGPADGRVVDLPEYIPTHYRIPIMPAIRYYDLGAEPAEAITRAVVYQLIRAFDMQPSRDDQGRLRYRYLQESAI